MFKLFFKILPVLDKKKQFIYFFIFYLFFDTMLSMTEQLLNT